MITQEQVAQHLVLSTITEFDRTTAVIAPRMEWAASILKNFYQLHSELPTWLQPKFTHKIRHTCTTENRVKIILAANPCSVRGFRLDRIYLHSDLANDEDWKYVLLPCIVANSAIMVVYS